MIYRTKDGDVLDALCAKHYGNTLYTIERVFDANPGLAAYGPVLPSGLLITFPDIEAETPKQATIRLWD